MGDAGRGGGTLVPTMAFPVQLGNDAREAWGTCRHLVLPVTR